MTDIIAFRKQLHQNPEISGSEFNTAKRIKDFFAGLEVFEIIEEVGGNGLLAIFNSAQPGLNIVVRAELDALPIIESNEFSYKSVNYGVSHKCGHDGHMAILCQLAMDLKSSPPARGKVIFLFQPAEETGEGAAGIINDSKFLNLNPDFCFALHNLPGFPRNAVICRPGVFASASVGARIKVYGKTSHAAHPENAINPIIILNEIFSVISEKFNGTSSIITPIALNSGSNTFGTSPRDGYLLLTLRTETTENLKKLQEELKTIVHQHCINHKAEFSVSFEEEFYATSNDSTMHGLVKEAAEDEKLNFVDVDKPFRWSEDFGRFLDQWPGALFGFGAGESSPQLHNPDYDFPDEIIIPAASLFKTLIHKIIANAR